MGVQNTSVTILFKIKVTTTLLLQWGVAKKTFPQVIPTKSLCVMHCLELCP